MDIETITAAVGGLKYVKNTFSYLHTKTIDSESKKKVEEALEKFGDIQNALYSLREENFSIQTKNEELRKKLSTYENWEEKISSYELTESPGGAIAYYFKDDPQHYACPSCANNKHELHILPNGDCIGQSACPGCKTPFTIS